MSHPGPGEPWQTGIVSEIGARSEMQDRHVLVAAAGGLFGGVYDGHGGIETVELVTSRLHAAFLDALADGQAPGDAFRHAFALVDDVATDEASGTTATAFFLAGGRLVAANVGDGRAVVVQRDRGRPLTTDHRLDDPEERRRVVEAGGEIDWPYVMRAGNGLMVTRSLGDRFFRPVGVIATPDVTVHEVTPADLFLVVASDGLWDVLSTEDVAGIVRAAGAAQPGASALASAVTARRGRDNLTILIVDMGGLATGPP